MSSNVPRRQSRTGKPLVEMTFRMPLELHEDLIKAADRAKLSRTAWIVSVLAQKLDHPEHDQITPVHE